MLACAHFGRDAMPLTIPSFDDDYFHDYGLPPPARRERRAPTSRRHHITSRRCNSRTRIPAQRYSLRRMLRRDML